VVQFEHKVAKILAVEEEEEPVWVARFLNRMDMYDMRNAARMQNIFCVSDDYPIYPIPLVQTKNGVNAGEIPPGMPFLFIKQISHTTTGFPATRGDLKGMTLGNLRTLASFYKVVPPNQNKLDVLRSLCVLFGLRL
jgi:hypothetical protein